MTYFKNFPKISYSLTPSTGVSKYLTNLTVSAKIVEVFPDKASLAYVDYIIKDGERPEHIANRVYGKSEYHWIILLSNLILDPYFDWPKSSLELENHIKKTYPGICLFFPCVGSPTFNLKNSTTKLISENSHFVVGNNISQTNGSVTSTGEILKWNPSFRKLEVINIDEGTFLPDVKIISKNSNQDEFEAIPVKVVYDNAEAVHNFEDDFGNILDPYGKINYYEYDDNKVYTNSNIFVNNSAGLPSTSSTQSENDFALNKYISGNSQINVVTNRQYENNLNDSKRKIRILKVEYVDKIANQMTKIFNNV